MRIENRTELERIDLDGVEHVIILRETTDDEWGPYVDLIVEDPDGNTVLLSPAHPDDPPVINGYEAGANLTDLERLVRAAGYALERHGTAR